MTPCQDPPNGFLHDPLAFSRSHFSFVLLTEFRFSFPRDHVHCSSCSLDSSKDPQPSGLKRIPKFLIQAKCNLSPYYTLWMTLISTTTEENSSEFPQISSLPADVSHTHSMPNPSLCYPIWNVFKGLPLH